MRKLLILLSLCVLAWSEPLWINNPTYNGEYVAAIGIAEAHFPKHAQERVALMRAKAELSDIQNMDINSEVSIDKKESKEGAENKSSSKTELKSSTALKVKVKEKYMDDEGVLYLWVIAY